MPQYIQKPGGEKTTLKEAGFSSLQEASDKGGFQPVSAPTQQTSPPREEINNQVNASELANQRSAEEEVTRVKEQVQNKQNAKQRVKETYEGLQDKSVRANEAFIQAAAQAAKGRPASPDELKSPQESEFGLRGAS